MIDLIDSLNTKGRESEHSLHDEKKIYYKSHRIIDGKPRLVIVDDNGNITDKNPDKKILKRLKVQESHRGTTIDGEKRKYNDTNTCSRIRDNGKLCRNQLISGHTLRESDKEGRLTGRWICRKCWNDDYRKYYPNSYNSSIKPIANCRTGNSNRGKYNDTNTCDTCKEKNIETKLAPGYALREYDKEGIPTGRWTCIKCYKTYKMYGTYEKPEIYYNDTNMCPRCREENIETKLIPQSAYKEYDKEGKKTGRYICPSHHFKDVDKYDSNSHNNIRKSIAGIRTGNIRPNTAHAKGYKSQKLACLEFGWTDLNDEHDNYRFPIDCIDPKTGLFHQIRGKWYDPINRFWGFTDFGRERHKEFEDIVCYCIGRDGKTIERIYIFPKKEIMNRTGVTIFKNPKDRWNNSVFSWYDQYRVKDKCELNKANDIWKSLS